MIISNLTLETETVFFDSKSGVDTHGGHREGMTDKNYSLIIFLRKIGVISEYPAHSTYKIPKSGTYVINCSIEVAGGTQTYSRVESLKIGEEVALKFGNRVSIHRLY